MASTDLLRRRPMALRIAVALAAVVAAQGLQLALWHYTQPSPFMFSLAAVMVAAWYGGAPVGWLATVVALPGIDYYFLVPYRGWGPLRADAVVSLALFVAVGCALTYLLSLSNRALIRAQHEIEERRRAEGERDHFIAALGHDLRNPLSAINMASHLVLRKPDLPEALRDPIGRIAGSCDRMDRLITQLLDFARARSGGLVIERQRLDLRELCAEVISETRLTCGGECNLALHGSGNAVGDWDRDRLLQVAHNLVSNAVEHRLPESPIDITVAPCDGHVQLTIENRARPLAPDELARLFDPFSRVSKRKTGLGLGLFISRQIVEAHGGTITAESDANVVRFRVILPRHAPPSASR